MFGLTAHVQLSGSGRVLDCKLLQLCRPTLYAYDLQLIVGYHKFVKFVFIAGESILCSGAESTSPRAMPPCGGAPDSRASSR